MNIEAVNALLANQSNARRAHLREAMQEFSYLAVDPVLDESGRVTVIFFKEGDQFVYSAEEGHHVFSESMLLDRDSYWITHLDGDNREAGIFPIAELTPPEAEGQTLLALTRLPALSRAVDVVHAIHALQDLLSFEANDAEGVYQPDLQVDIELIHERVEEGGKYGYLVYRLSFKGAVVGFFDRSGRYLESYSASWVNASALKWLVDHLEYKYGPRREVEFLSIDTPLAKLFEFELMETVDAAL